jgi:uncharacterized membrane protein
VSSAQDSYTGHALLYSGTRLIDLGVFGTGGYNQSQAAAINNQGWVVGWADKNRNILAALWKNGQIIQVAPNIAEDHFGINNAASPQITGSYHPKPGQTNAYIWQSGTLTNLPFGSGHAINDLGQIAGSNGDSACFWSQASGLKILPDLGFGGGTSADGINNAAFCIGYSHDSAGRYHAVYWDSNRVIHDMGLFVVFVDSVPKPSETKALGINNSAVIVGVAFVPGPNSHAMRWNSASGWADLNTLVDPVAYPGWVLASASGINDRGQIVGTAYRSGDPNEHAFILTPLP